MFPDYPVYFILNKTFFRTESCGVNINLKTLFSGVTNIKANVKLHEYKPMSVKDVSDTNSLHTKPFKPENGIRKNV
jgi:hypothetical protein